uniref:Lipase 3 n=3 Tax=Culex pipiens complex TaxID=518105 RepID=A0A8D8MA98_CULPI
MAESLAGGYTAFGSHELLPNWRYQYEFYRALCPAPQQLLCRMLIYEVAGANPDQLDTKMLRIFLGHFPAGSGIKQFLHYAQYIREGIFRQFDYGDDRLNRAAYGSATAPRYNLTRVSTPVWTYYGLNDNVVNYRNVRRLERELPNLAGSYQVPDERFTHADFILSNNVKRVLYRKVIRNLEAAERGAN